MKRFLMLTAWVSLLACPAFAQDTPTDQPSQGAAVGAAGPGTASMQGMGARGMAVQRGQDPFMGAMMHMHQGMMMAEDAEADRAFALKMIEHHQGGVRMAEILAAEGDDAELKEMAARMMEEQRRHVEELGSWLDRHGSQAGGER